MISVDFETGSRLKTIAGGYSSPAYYDSDVYGAFFGCSKLTSIEIPASVEFIEATAFRNCTSLSSVAFGAGSQLKTIGGGYDNSSYYGAFSGCSKLADFNVPSNVEFIEDAAFYGCSSLTSVAFDANSQLKEIGYAAFANCRRIFIATLFVIAGGEHLLLSKLCLPLQSRVVLCLSAQNGVKD